MCQPVDIASSAYQYRADRAADQNPPESWLALMKYAKQPLNTPVNAHAAEYTKVLCGLIWEEVRRVRRVALVWSGAPERRPKPEDIALTFFDAEANSLPTWWNQTVLREAGKAEVSADGTTYSFAIPADTFGLVVSVRDGQSASAYEVPEVRVFTPDVWKKMNLEIEWGFDKSTAGLSYSGRIETHDGIVDHVKPLPNDVGTTLKGSSQWQSASISEPIPDGRRGVSLSLLYQGTSQYRKVWPYNGEPEDVARTIVTVWTNSGNFSFLASDLEKAPILAPEYGFFVRSVDSSAPASQSANDSSPPFLLRSKAASAREFIEELATKHLTTIRQRTRQHAEQTWEGAVGAMFPGKTLPAIPKAEFEPPMQVDLPCKKLTAQWKLGAWHILRRSVKDANGKWHFNDYPYGILACETYAILYALDLQGMHKEAADGLDQWLSLPMQTHIEPGKGGHNPQALPDRPLGLFTDGRGCLTNAEGPPGVGGQMDGIHPMGPGTIMYAISEHYRLTGDVQWLKTHIDRIKANAEWILRQRRMLANSIPGGERLWSKGLQPANCITTDSGGQFMQYYETEAYYWLAIQRMAELLAPLDPKESARMAAEAEIYRKDLTAAVERSIALSPVVLVRDGTYRSFIPFACYVRGFASGAWSWRRPGSVDHVGGLYWDATRTATDMVISYGGILSPQDRRVQGYLDVLEDRLFLENPKVFARTTGYDPGKDWFAHAGWNYQCSPERQANIYLDAEDTPNFLRSFLNQYAVDIVPEQGYIFNEHTTRGPPDKIYEEASFLERFRDMLVMEEGDSLWLARATPREWLEQGKKISVQNAPTHFGTASYEIMSDVAHGKITATIEMPSRNPPKHVLLRFRHPQALPMKSVTISGSPWADFDPLKETIRIHDVSGTVKLEAAY